MTIVVRFLCGQYINVFGKKKEAQTLSANIYKYVISRNEKTDDGIIQTTEKTSDT